MGDLLDLIMLDTRHYDRSITGLGWNDNYIGLIEDDASRSLMGPRQENWFYKSLSDSADRGATWRLVGNQLRFARLERMIDGELDVSTDSWEVSFLRFLSVRLPCDPDLIRFCRPTVPTRTALSSTSVTMTSATLSSLLATPTSTGYVSIPKL